MGVKGLQQEVLFREPENRLFFIGDSVSYRNFGFTVNLYLPFSEINGYEKIMHVPNHINMSVVIREDELVSMSIKNYTRIDPGLDFSSANIAKARKSTVHYVKIRYISLSVPVVTDAIEQAEGGLVVLYFGTWDLNWQINARERVPYLNGPIRHLPTAISYWTKHVQKLMEAIQRALERLPVHRRPLIMFFEQLPLNCLAGRFVGRANRFKRCEEFTAPVVVPLYRRVLAAMAWHLNIPVVPTTHFFKNDYQYCKLSDGVHLDPPCMITAQQHLWNAYLLMRRKHVLQGLPPEIQQLPDAMSFVDNESYTKWMSRIDKLEEAHVERGEVFQLNGATAAVTALWMMMLVLSVAAFIFSRGDRCALRGRQSASEG
ncbi:glutamine-dependent carbamoyl-phosphate synthetase [Trypanosoma grayi]|uniref:glutamine-dependent carbamoyl-phosphate synthetase n=1 Tax=Trypanosoma grayi TaxID=71804 RepID=UPI0004F49242|nr:glutamine-dependent carbamoyl-phosphate synthetase [Trypanosoma grayi]KEG07593.1 glutamine-dependent carbamoyl-phosphate synthetase [Trypanosoma grayi]